MVVFDAARLRDKLAPQGLHEADAAQTLESCVEARHEDEPNPAAHYFEVRLQGFTNPPLECQNYDVLRTFLRQVSPLPYDPGFTQREEILRRAGTEKVKIEWVRVFAQDGAGELEELFKPYRADVAVKKARVPFTIDYVGSPRGAWWGWIGRKRVSGLIKDGDVKGIRVRVRNIQIDGTDVIRDIFAVSHLGGKPRSSYARFTDYYIGEVFIDPRAAIPNARRDGFEENPAWQEIRNELDVLVAVPYGKRAYKTSTDDQLSIDSLNKRFAELKISAAPLIVGERADWNRVSEAVVEAKELQRRLSSAVKAADEDELDPLRVIADAVSTLKRELDGLIVEMPAQQDCGAEIEAALSDFTQKLFGILSPNPRNF